MDDKSKCRGEPVYQVNMKGNGWEDCSFARYESAGRVIAQDAKKGWKRWKRRVLWTGPQPAEPAAEKHGCHGGEGATLPAEPVKTPSDAELLFALRTIEPHLKDVEAAIPALITATRLLLKRYGNAAQPEPVKVPSDADAKHVQDFINCDGMGAVIVEGPQYSAVVRALLARYGKPTNEKKTVLKNSNWVLTLTKQ